MKHLHVSLVFGALVGAAQAQISFTAAGVATTGQRANVAAFGDFDGDGFDDMAVTTDGNGVQDLVELHRGNGNGTFTAAGTVFMPNSSSPHGLVAADLDGDGDVDLAVGLADTGQVLMLSNMGGFAFVQTSSAATGGQESRSLVGGDLDGDGDMDLAMANRDSNDVSVVMNQGGALTSVGRFAAGAEPRDVAIGDFTGDGVADLAVSSHDDRTVRILVGNGAGSFAAGQILTAPAATRPQGMAAADLDGDGDMDVIAGCGDDAVIGFNVAAVYTNTGAGLTGPIGYPTGGLDAGDVLAADLDGDGDVDVAVSNESSGHVALLANSGAGALALAGTLTAGGQPSDIGSGDLDGNGSVDLGVTRRQTAGVSIFVNDGAGTGGPVGTNYCTANLNSTAQAARLSGSGSASVAANDLVLTCDQMPAGSFSLFLVSQTTDFVVGAGGSFGNLCLGGAIGRYNNAVQMSDATGSVSLPVDWTQIPQPNAFVSATAGQVWNFQCWFRDTLGGVSTSNYSDGLSVTVQ